MSGKISIICGHYGCGKTNFTLNLARDAAGRGEKVAVVDLDIVNPYFRTSDYTQQLEKLGIRVISPSLAGTTLDSPSLSANIFSVFGSDETVFFDVGGDDAGAGALGRFSEKIKQLKNVEMLYVVNCFRPITSTPQGAVEILREIERASGICAAKLVNNSHLCTLTCSEDIVKGYSYALEVSKLCGLPLMCTAVPRALCDGLQETVEDIYLIDTLVKLPFDEQ